MSNLAKALAAGTREAGSASGRTSDKGRSPSRSSSPRRAVPLRAAWKHNTVLSRAVGRSPRSAEDPAGGVPCDRDHDAYRNRAASVLPEGDQLVAGFRRVCGSASFWSTVCGRCCGCWSLRQMDRQLGQRCPPTLLEGRRTSPRCIGLAFRARTRLLERPRLQRGAPSSWYTEVLGSLVEKNVGDQLFRSNSTADLGCQSKILCQARHQGRLDAGLGSPLRWRRTPEAQDSGVLLLERAVL